MGDMYATFTDPTGVVYELTDTSDSRGYFTRRGPAGWGARPYKIVSDPRQRGGDEVRFIRAEPVRLIWPLHVWGDTHLSWLERYRSIKLGFLRTAHRQAPGVLTVARLDGSARSIDVFYEEGFEGNAGEDWLSSNPVLTLFAPDGYWRDVNQVIETREFQVGTVPYLAPYRTVSSPQVLGATEIDNVGEVTAWPEWTVTGPASALTGTNLTTGQSFTLTYEIDAGETITLTTLQPTARGPADENIMYALDWPTADLWGLQPGVNSVEFDVDGAGVGTTVTLRYYPRYDGA